MLYITIIYYSTIFIKIVKLFRYKKENLLLLATLPGPQKPKDINNMLQPIYNELTVLQNEGMVVTTPDKQTFYSRVHLILTGGDIIGLGDIIGHSHSSYFGCHLCVIEGVRGEHGGIYFPPSSGTLPRLRKTSSFRKGSKKVVAKSAQAVRFKITINLQ